MHRLAYIFPLLTACVLILYLQNYDQWVGYLIMVVAAELILWRIIHRVTHTDEYLSGYALNVQHHEPWVERVVRTETYTDSRGNTHTRQRVEYYHHPDRWIMPLNTDIEVDITSDVYNHYRRMWRTTKVRIHPPHVNCVSGGGGELYEWNGIYDDAATHTYKGSYINYVVNSNSIFRMESISRGDAEKYGLVNYPKFRSNHLEQDVVLRSPKLSENVVLGDDVQRIFHLINAFSGAKHQIHIFVIVFDATQGIAAALKQQAYWKRGNKNEFVVCLGIDSSSTTPHDTTHSTTDNRGNNVAPNDDDNSHDTNTPEQASHNCEQHHVAWCKAFSWCDVPQLESATESYFIEHKEFDLHAYASWLKDNLRLWRRKEFADFAYLGIQLSTGHKVVLVVSTLLLSILIVVIAIYTMLP